MEKILVKNGKVYGVRTKRGDEIHCDYVVSGAYPNKVYTQMIEPLSEVPEGAIKMINGRRLSVCPVSVMMMIEGDPEENGFYNYSTFSGETMDTNKIWENYPILRNHITTLLRSALIMPTRTISLRDIHRLPLQHWCLCQPSRM